MTTRPTFSFFCVVLVTLTACGIASGQDIKNELNIGFPENGAFSGGKFDSRQHNNGDLHIELPLWSVKGRGLSVGFKYVYDNKGWSIQEQCNKRYGFCTGTIVEASSSGDMVNPNMHWNLVGPTHYGLNSKSSVQECNNVTQYAAWSYSVTEPDGTTHGMVPRLEGQCTSWAPLGTVLHASDGSGWSLHVNASTGQPQYATSPNGTTVYPSGSSVAVEDTQGNQITIGSSTITDTLGRTFPGNGLSYFDSSGNQQTFQVTYQNVTVQTHLCPLYSGLQSCGEYSATWSMPHQIVLPGGQLTYTINYSTAASYGEPTSIILPTGGQISYTWGGLATGGESLATRTETLGSQSYTWDYTNLTDPAGNATAYTCHFIGTGPSPVCYITNVKYYQGSTTSGVLLKSVDTGYTQTGGGSTLLLPTSETTTWSQFNLVTEIATTYDSVGVYLGPLLGSSTVLVHNPTSKQEYAYGSGSPGPLARTNSYTYLHNSNSSYGNLNILDAISSKVVADASGNVVAQTTYSYDGTPITSTSGTPAPNHDYTNFGSSFTTRGNITQVGNGLLANGSWTWLNTTNTYDDLGNKLSTTDPKQNTTSFSYVDNWGTDTQCTLGSNTFAYLATVTDPLQHQTKRSYYRCTGLVSSTKDQNDINNAGPGTTLTYDFLNRPSAITYPDGGQTTSIYVDTTPLIVTKKTLVAAGLDIQHAMVFDGLGRPQQSQFNDPDCGGGTGLVKIDHVYGYTSGAGAFAQVSTPYCNSPNSTYGLMTTTNYDTLDRVTSVVQTDSSTVTTSYSGNSSGLTSTVADESGKQRMSQTDALGRITAVFEDPNGANYETDYSYDTLDDLIGVTQKGGAASSSWRTRSFTYDSLSRLVCAANPEITPGLSTVNPATCPASYTGTYTNGTIGYSYDNDSNLIAKTAPAPNQTSTSSTVTTNYSYDNGNRLSQKTYTGNPSTASIQYGYDGTALTGCSTTPPTLSPADANPVGYRTSMCDGSGATSWSHDSMGRVLAEQRIINGTSAINKSVKYTYFKDGEVDTLAYPSGHTITYSPNSANGYSAGRPVSAVDSGSNYVTSATYAPQGALAGLMHGGTINAGFTYNSRMQPLQMAYGTGTPTLTGTTCPSSPASLLHRLYDFHLDNGDNGNVQVINNCRDTNRTQNFFYDNLNRITQAYTNGNSPLSTSWGEAFTIDPWGNLTNIAGVSGKTNTELLNASPASIKNQLNGFCNDAAGNLVLNTACPAGSFTPTYSYDIENRLTSAAAGYSYVYDGDGERVTKCSNSGCTAGTL